MKIFLNSIAYNYVNPNAYHNEKPDNNKKEIDKKMK